MSKLRSVNTKFWNDIYVIDLDPIEKLLFLYLLTNEQTNMLGIYELHIRRIAFDTGIDKDMIIKMFARFEKSGKAKYINGHVILPNFIKNQSFNTNMEKSAIRIWNELPAGIRADEFVEPIIKGLKGFNTHGKGLKIPPDTPPKNADSIDTQDEKGEPLQKASEPIAKREREIELEKETETEEIEIPDLNDEGGSKTIKRKKTKGKAAVTPLELYDKIVEWIKAEPKLWASYKSNHGILISDKAVISSVIQDYCDWCGDRDLYLDKTDPHFHFGKVMKWLKKSKAYAS